MFSSFLIFVTISVLVVFYMITSSRRQNLCFLLSSLSSFLGVLIIVLLRNNSIIDFSSLEESIQTLFMQQIYMFDIIRQETFAWRKEVSQRPKLPSACGDKEYTLFPQAEYLVDDPVFQYARALRKKRAVYIRCNKANISHFKLMIPFTGISISPRRSASWIIFFVTFPDHP